MATLGQQHLTLLDVAKGLDPDGKPAKIAELLQQENPILQDMPWIEANGATHHRTSVRTGLPNVFWRRVNEGVQPSKSTKAQIDEGMGILEAWSEVDVVLAKLSGNVGAFRLSEASAFLQAMNNEFSQTLFYGNSSVSPEEFNGLSIRYSSTTPANGQNILKAGGSDPADNTSIWLVGWSPETITGIYPKGSPAGLEHKDLGEQIIQDVGGVQGAKMLAYVDQFNMTGGIALKDWRYAVRIANIDVSALVAGSGNADLTKFMIQAMHRLPNLVGVRPVWYMNRTAFSYLDIQRYENVKAASIGYTEIDGKEVPTFRGAPIKVVDALLDTEAAIS